MKGICFIPPLYDATIKEIKDETRRIIPNCDSLRQSVFVKSNYETWHGRELKPKYKVGEVVYLKEPYRITHSHNIWYVSYKFDEQVKELPFSWGHKGLEKLCIQQEKSKSGWLNKLFMPSWCARRFIKITGVRAERLQDITEEDCIKEGIHVINKKPICIIPLYGIEEMQPLGKSLKEAYATLIDKINGKGTWDNNPLVWVYDYKLTDNTKEDVKYDKQ